MNFLGFGQSAEIDIVFDGGETRKTVEVKGEDGKMEKLLLYYDGETVSGKVNVTLKKPGSKLEHQGIKIEFIGQIELFYDRGNHHEFKGIVKALARPGDLIQNTSYPFEFPNVEKSFETYAGSNVRLRYFLRATIVRRISDITREVDIAVHTLCSYPDLNNPIKMEVGIEDCLHIEFEYNKSKYHLKDVIVGKIYFLLVRIKIKHMEIAIIKRESTGSGPNMFTENETIAKYEIMDGAPVKGESIPIRVFLAGYSLTPTMRDINKKFSVKYFLNLVLMDTEDRRYFKQQEITLWRKADKTRKSQSLHSTNHPHAPTHLVGTNVGGHDSDLQTRYGIVGSMQTSSSSVLQNPGLTDDDLMNAIGGGGVSSSSSVGGVGVINSGMTASHTDDGGLSSILSGQRGGSGETESKMGLFTRESPQQEYSQHEDSSIISSSSSSLPRSTIISSRPSAEMLRGTADGAASNSAQNDGGTAAAAALASASVISNDDFSPTSNRTAAAITRTGGGGGGVLEESSTITPTTPISIPAPSSSSQFIFETQNAVMVSTTPPPLLPTTTIAATLQSTSALEVMEKDDDDVDDDGIHHQQQYTTTTATSSRKGAIPTAIPIAVPVAVSPITSGVPNVPSPSSSSLSSIATKTITATTKATKTATASALTIDDEEEMINVPLNSTAFTSTKIVKRKNRADDDDDDDDYDDGKNKDNDDDIGGGGGSGVHRDSNKHD